MEENLQCKSDFNGNNSYEAYCPELPRIEEELKDLNLDECIDSNPKSNNNELHPKLSNTLDEISTYSQFSSFSGSGGESLFDASFERKSPEMFSLKLVNNNLYESPKTDKECSPNSLHLEGEKHSSPNSHVRRALFCLQSPKSRQKRAMKSQDEELSEQIRMRMKKLKQNESKVQRNRKPVLSFKNSLEYHMTKPAQLIIDSKTNNYGGQRNKRFQGHGSKQLRNDEITDGFKCKSCAMTFRYFCNLKSHFVVVHQLVREEDLNVPNILSKSNPNSPSKNSFDGNSKQTDKDKTSSNQNLELYFLEHKTSEKYRQLLYGTKHNLHFCELCEKFFKFHVNLCTHKNSIHSM